MGGQENVHPKGTSATAVHAFTPGNTDELPLKVGLVVRMHATPKEGGWWQGEDTQSGQLGWFPQSHVFINKTVKVDQSTPAAAADTADTAKASGRATSATAASVKPARAPVTAAASEAAGDPPDMAVALFEYQPVNQDELRLVVGRAIELTQTPEGGWWQGRLPGESQPGWFPSTHVQRQPRASKGAPATPSTGTASPPQSGRVGGAKRETDDARETGSGGGSGSSGGNSPKAAASPSDRRAEAADSNGQTPPAVLQIEDEFGFEGEGGAGVSLQDAVADAEAVQTQHKGELRVAVHDFAPTHQDELALAVGTQVTLVQTPAGGWWQGTTAAQPTPSWFPANHVREPARETARSGAAQGAAGQPLRLGKAKNKAAPPQPPPASAVPDAADGGRLRASSLPPMARSGSRESMRPRRPSLTGLMQTRRGALNAAIAKELKMREGAENLLRVLNDRRKDKAAREEVLITLSFVNSRLQQLRSELMGLNAKVHAAVRQSVHLSASKLAVMDNALDEVTLGDGFPLIALGLKECAPLSWKEPLSNALRQHYYAEPGDFTAAIASLQRLRNGLVEQLREVDSKVAHGKYYHQLVHLERRFFKRFRCPGVHFQWYDSFNGQPSSQCSLALEKACTLFNMAALSTQLAAAGDHSTEEGLSRSLDHLQEAAGTFQFIADNFNHAPTADLSRDTLHMLSTLCLAQAQECMLLRQRKAAAAAAAATTDAAAEAVSPGVVDSSEAGDPAPVVREPNADEVAAVAEMCHNAARLLDSERMKDYVPRLWRHLMHVKALFYESMADFQTAVEQLANVKRNTRNEETATWTGVARMCRAELGCIRTAKIARHSIPEYAWLGQAVDAELRKVRDELAKVDRSIVLQRFKHKYDLKDMLPAKTMEAALAVPTYPMLYTGSDGSLAEDDLFKALGPVAVFNSQTTFEPARAMSLVAAASGFGMVLSGSTPVAVHSVEPDSPAAEAGLRPGDVVLMADGQDVVHGTHDDVIALIQGCGGSLDLVVQQMHLPATVEEEEDVALLGDAEALAPGSPVPSAAASRLGSASTTTTAIDRTHSLLPGSDAGATSLTGFGGSGSTFGAFAKPSSDLTGKAKGRRSSKKKSGRGKDRMSPHGVTDPFGQQVDVFHTPTVGRSHGVFA